MLFTNQQHDVMRCIFQRYARFHVDQLVADIKQGLLSVSLATVHRTLDKMVLAGLLRRVEGQSGCFEHDVGR